MLLLKSYLFTLVDPFIFLKDNQSLDIMSSLRSYFKQARIALERRKFLKNADTAVRRQAMWSNLAHEMTAEFRGLCAEEVEDDLYLMRRMWLISWHYSNICYYTNFSALPLL